MEKSNFDRLLQRYLAGQVTEEEKIKIESWLEVMKTEDPTSLELSQEDEERIFLKITGNISEGEKITLTPERKQISLRPWAIGIAAAFIMASISFLLWNNTKDSTEKMILNDGTLVWNVNIEFF